MRVLPPYTVRVDGRGSVVQSARGRVCDVCALGTSRRVRVVSLPIRACVPARARGVLRPGPVTVSTLESLSALSCAHTRREREDIPRAALPPPRARGPRFTL